MGHVPSKELSKKHFVADIGTTRGHVDTVAAVALTQDNFKNADDPLFQQFVAVRSDAPVLYWYCVPDGCDRGELPPTPSAEETYSKRVIDAQDVVDTQPHHDSFVPLPVMIVRLADEHRKKAYEGEVNLEGAVVVGYVGCRQFGQKGSVYEHGIIGIFLSKQFFNDAKSIAMLCIACKCYEYFSKAAGCESANWPKDVGFATYQDNLPCLRLIQKIYQCYVFDPTGTDIRVEGDFKITYPDNRIKVRAKGWLIKHTCERLASQVQWHEGTDGSAGRFSMKAQILEADPNALLPDLDRVVEHAKAQWRQANEPVIRTQLKSESRRRKSLVSNSSIDSNPMVRKSSTHSDGLTVAASVTSAVTSPSGSTTGVVRPSVSPPEAAVRVPDDRAPQCSTSNTHSTTIRPILPTPQEATAASPKPTVAGVATAMRPQTQPFTNGHHGAGTVHTAAPSHLPHSTTAPVQPRPDNTGVPAVPVPSAVPLPYSLFIGANMPVFVTDPRRQCIAVYWNDTRPSAVGRLLPQLASARCL